MVRYVLEKVLGLPNVCLFTAMSAVLCAGGAGSVVHAGSVSLDEVIQQGQYAGLRPGDDFDDLKIRLSTQSELELRDTPGLGIHFPMGVVIGWPQPTIEIWRLDRRVAVVVDRGEIALLSIPFAAKFEEAPGKWTTADGLIRSGASDRDVVAYLARHEIPYRIVEAKQASGDNDKQSAKEFRNYVIDSTRVILKVMDGKLTGLLACNESIFSALAENPERYDFPLFGGRFWVEPQYMETRLTHAPQPTCPAASEEACLQSPVILLLTGINKDGSVRTLGVDEGKGPFLQEAIRAVQEWIFDPYLVDDKPVEVVTRFRLVFPAAGQ